MKMEFADETPGKGKAGFFQGARNVAELYQSLIETTLIFCVEWLVLI